MDHYDWVARCWVYLRSAFFFPDYFDFQHVICWFQQVVLSRINLCLPVAAGTWPTAGWFKETHRSCAWKSWQLAIHFWAAALRKETVHPSQAIGYKFKCDWVGASVCRGMYRFKLQSLENGQNGLRTFRRWSPFEPFCLWVCVEKTFGGEGMQTPWHALLGKACHHLPSVFFIRCPVYFLYLRVWEVRLFLLVCVHLRNK